MAVEAMKSFSIFAISCSGDAKGTSGQLGAAPDSSRSGAAVSRGAARFDWRCGWERRFPVDGRALLAAGDR
jgi:hypothetical protein